MSNVNHRPPRLFKYLHPSRIDVLERARIRFSPPHAFNDPFDLKPNIQGFVSRESWNRNFMGALPKAIDEEYARLPESVRATLPRELVQAQAHAKFPDLVAESYGFAQLLPSLFRSMVEIHFEKMVGILSLTEKPDNLLMWAHYADSHQGLVIEVDPTHGFFNRRRSENDEFLQLRQVLYRNERPTLNPSEDSSFETFLTKGRDWEYEQEWRMLVPLSEATEVIRIPSIDVHLFAFPKSVIKSVIVGARASQETEGRVVDIVLNDPEYRNVRVQRASADLTQYKLLFRALKD